MDKLININGVLLKQENVKEVRTVETEFLDAVEELNKIGGQYIEARINVTKKLDALKNIKPMYSIQGIDTKQTFTEFTGFSSSRYRYVGQ
jgi:isocitrate/isopropylmalate dehydrogenase